MAPLEITVTGTSSTIHAAELAIMSITITDVGNTQALASASISKTITHVQSMLNEKAPKHTHPEAGITHWKQRALQTTSFDSKGSKRIFRMTTGFEIHFKDFTLLGSWANALGSTPNVSVESIKWALSEVTRKRVEAEGRMRCAEDAIVKARDFAEAFGVERGAVRAVEVTGTKDESKNENGYEGGRRGHGGYSSSYEEGGTLAFSGEEIKIDPHSSRPRRIVLDASRPFHLSHLSEVVLAGDIHKLADTERSEIEMSIVKRIVRQKFLSWNAASAGQIEVIKYLEELINLVKLLVGANEFRSGMLTRPTYREYVERIDRGAKEERVGRDVDGAADAMAGDEQDELRDVVPEPQPQPQVRRRRPTFSSGEKEPTENQEFEKQKQVNEEELPRSLQRVRTRRIEEMSLQKSRSQEDERKKREGKRVDKSM